MILISFTDLCALMLAFRILLSVNIDVMMHSLLRQYLYFQKLSINCHIKDCYLN